MFSQGLFTAQLIMSNPKLFKYSLVWEKDRPTGFLNAKKMPLRSHEDILVFYKKLPIYNPQMWQGIPLHSKGQKGLREQGKNNNYNKYNTTYDSGRTGTTEKYPRSVLKFNKEHPAKFATQKPIALLKYLIKTYSLPSSIILDNCMGSGSTLIAAGKLNRIAIGIESNKENYELSKKRFKEFNLNFNEIKGLT